MVTKAGRMERCGAYTWFGYVLPFEKKLELLRNAGFSTICTWWGDLFSDIDGRKEDQAVKAAAAGLTLEHTHLPYMGCDRLWFPDGEELFQSYLRAIPEIAENGIPTAVMHPFEKVLPRGEWNLGMDRLSALGEQAKRAGVRLALENIVDNVHLEKILTGLGDNPFVGLCFDTGHNQLARANDFSLVETFRDRLFALHVHDNHGLRDEHLIPYDGNLDWIAFANAMAQTTYSGSLMLESCYPVDWDKLPQDGDFKYPQPPIPPEAYLAEAKGRCDRVMNGPK